MVRKIILLVLFTLLCVPALFSSAPADASVIGQADGATTIIVSDGTSVMAADDLLLADVPIAYGEESFRERILERTGGQRDPIGLVLTGGSARAFAHLGVLKYLEDQGIEPDFIISNSMGSIIALLYAAGLSSDQIMSVVTSGDLSTFFKMTIPIEGGLLEPAGFKGLVESVVGSSLQIEDLEIPVMVICQDLVTKREVRIMEGPFSDIMLASFAIPAYFPPQEYRGHLLVDGGIINLAPIAVAYDYSDTVIVSTTFYDNDQLNLKNILNILNVSFEIGKRQNAASELREYGDRMIWIRCGVEKFSFMDFGAAAEMAQIGYQSAQEVADQLSGLYRHGLSPSIAQRRIELQRNIDEVIQNQYYFSRVGQPNWSNTISLGMYTFQTNEYPYYLRNTFDVGLEYKLSSRVFEFSTLVGGAYDATRNKDVQADFLISLGMSYYPINQMRFSLYSAFTFNGYPEWYVPSIYARQGFDYKIFSSRYFTLEFNQALELYQDFGNERDEDQYMLTARLKGAVNLWDYARLNLTFGYMLTMPSFSSTPHHYLQTSADTRLYVIPDATTFYFDIGLMSRFSLDGSMAPIYPADGFITNSKTLNDGGKFIYSEDGTPSFNDQGQGYFVLLPLSFGYAFTSAPSFGELLMADYLELSVFCDLLFNDGFIPEYTTGIELQFELSLIGLQNIPMTFRFGYDSLGKGMIFSLRFAVTK